MIFGANSNSVPPVPPGPPFLESELSVFPLWLFSGGPPTNHLTLYKYKGYDRLSKRHVFFMRPRRQKHEILYPARIEHNVFDLQHLTHRRIFFPCYYDNLKLKEILDASI